MIPLGVLATTQSLVFTPIFDDLSYGVTITNNQAMFASGGAWKLLQTVTKSSGKWFLDFHFPIKPMIDAFPVKFYWRNAANQEVGIYFQFNADGSLYFGYTTLWGSTGGGSLSPSEFTSDTRFSIAIDINTGAYELYGTRTPSSGGYELLASVAAGSPFALQMGSAGYFYMQTTASNFMLESVLRMI